jgi:hypothetical protein
MDVGREIPGGICSGLATEHADRDLDAGEFRALELNRVDARQQVDGRVRDQPGVEEVPDIRGVAALRVFVVVGDEGLEVRGIARLGRGLGGVDERADLVLGRAGGPAGGACEDERETELTQGAPPTAAGRP